MASQEDAAQVMRSKVDVIIDGSVIRGSEYKMDNEKEIAEFVRELHALGITPATINAYEQLLADVARYKEPNDKFKYVGKALAIIKEIHKGEREYSNSLQIEYTERDAVITMHSYFITLNPGSKNKTIELAELIDFLDIYVHESGTVCLEMVIKNIFDIPGG